MSYSLRITVQRSDVFTEVNKTCGYIGVRYITKDGGSLYDAVSSDRYTQEMLLRFWNEACASVVTAGKEFVSSASGVDSSALVIGYTLSDAYNTSMDGSIRQLVFSYIVWYILFKWLEVCGLSELSQSYGQTAQLFLKQLDDMLYTRKTSRNLKSDSMTGDNVFGDVVAGDGGGGDDDGDEPVGDNQIGDIVDDISGDGTGGDGNEARGSNQIGDIVDDISGDGSGSDEPTGDNAIGDVLPQDFGEIEVVHYSVE